MTILSLHFLISILLLLNSLFIFLAKNPVYSLLFLILAFCNSSLLLFLFDVEFLGLVFIIIYVGAVAVLFLFVIMMLNIKKIEIKSLNTSIFSIFFTILFLMVFHFNLILETLFFNGSDLNNFFYNKLGESFDSLSNIDVMGQVLFNYYNLLVLIAGFILLIAILGAVCLTLNFNKIYRFETIKKQLAKSDKSISFF